jgi:formylglycine-generating enzyme required for sulfatase activity
VGDVAAVVASSLPLDAVQSTRSAVLFYQNLAAGRSPDEALDRGSLPETDWSWAFLELWVRPRALAGTGTRGAFQFVSPYRGLASFKERDADIFRGRHAEVEKLYQILSDEAVVAVVGDSGSGKTSLLQAGLVPKVRREGLAGLRGWRIVLLRPGTQPARSLMGSLLLGDDAADPALSDLPTPSLEAVPLLLKDACSPERPLLILFDQFEEMFTLCEDEAQRHGVARALADMARPHAPHFRLVLATRSEYLYQAAALRGLHDLIERPWVLSLPGPDAVRAIVEEPAAEYGYRFQGPPAAGPDVPGPQSLLQRILHDPLLTAAADARGDRKVDPSQTAAPLPLLEFALERLWLRAVERGTHEFTHADYDQMGGLGGAIAQHAEEVYQHLPANPKLGSGARRVAEQIITGLISSQGTRRPRQRGDLEAETGNPEVARRIIDHLVGERLLTLRSDPNDFTAPQVDLTHEVLIDRWQRLKEWLGQDREGRALKEAFQKDVERWDKGHGEMPPRSRKNLPAPEVAGGYLTLIDKTGFVLTDTQSVFVGELRGMLRRRRRRTRAVVGGSALVALVMTCLLLFAFWQQRARALAQVDALRHANPRAVPTLIDDLAPSRYWVDPRLRELLGQPGLPEGERLRVSLALLPVDRGQVRYLRDRLLEVEPQELLLIRNALLRHHPEAGLARDLWSVVDGPKADAGRKFRSLVALAAFDPGNNRWRTVRAPDIEPLLSANPFHLEAWVDGLRGVRLSLLAPLAEVFRTDQTERRQVAANILADYAKDRPGLLAELVADADAKQFVVLRPVLGLEGNRKEAAPLLRREIGRAAAADGQDEQGRAARASRRANAAAALLLLGEAEHVWPLLGRTPRPDARSYLVQRLAPLGVSAPTVICRLEQEEDVWVRRALILALGEFTEEQLPADLRARLVPRLLQWYRTDPDPGIHGAVDWLLRHGREGPEPRKFDWKQGPALRQIDEGLTARARAVLPSGVARVVGVAASPGAGPLLAASVPPAGPGAEGRRRWYVNGQGQTLVVFPEPGEFFMVAPQAPNRRPDETRHRRQQIGRSFALAAKAVTVEEFRKFRDAHPEVKHLPDEQFDPGPDGPVMAVTWYEAAQYCRWLSHQEGVPEDQMCYPPVATIEECKNGGGGPPDKGVKGGGAPLELPANYLARTGYRLPTEPEWEYACRAGAVTSRHCGGGDDLLARYAWYLHNSNDRPRPVGQKRPNDFGLFDMHGNVWQWCQESAWADAPGDKEGKRHVRADENACPFRGGSFYNAPLDVRSAFRLCDRPSLRTVRVGLRVARTCP